MDVRSLDRVADRFLSENSFFFPHGDPRRRVEGESTSSASGAAPKDSAPNGDRMDSMSARELIAAGVKKHFR